jgi:hypothetical protein
VRAPLCVAQGPARPVALAAPPASALQTPGGGAQSPLARTLARAGRAQWGAGQVVGAVTPSRPAPARVIDTPSASRRSPVPLARIMMLGNIVMD